MTWNFSPPKQCAKTGFFYATFLTYQNSFVYLKSIYLHVISFEGYSVTATMFMQKSHLKIKGKRHGRSLCLLLDLFNFFFSFSNSLPVSSHDLSCNHSKKKIWLLPWLLPWCMHHQIILVWIWDCLFRGSGLNANMVQISVALKSLKQLGSWLYRKSVRF